MRRRLYYVMPDLTSARTIMNDLLLARVEERHVHFLAKRGTPMDGLHEANVLQKSDLVHGAQLGLMLGAFLGCVTGGLLAMFIITTVKFQVITVLGATLAGALIGTWTSSMVASSVPNSHLKQFDAAIAQGGILLMIDVPAHKTDAIDALIAERHPEASARGMDPYIPAFP